MRRSLATALASAVVALSGAAHAAPIGATRCSIAETRCERAAFQVAREERGPFDFDYDTGWLPANSPVQVRLVAAVHARTRVAMGGALEATWPSAIALAPRGEKGTGVLAIDDGIEVVAQGRFDVQVAGQNFKWQGNLPVLPNVNLLAQKQVAFDPWAFSGAPSLPVVSATTPQVTLAQVPLTNSIIPIPGISGGFELEGAATFSAFYDTLRISFDDVGGVTPIPVVDLLAPSTQLLATRAPAFDTSLFLHGEVARQVTLHFIPAFYFQILNQKFSLPLADLPIALPKSKPVVWDFAPVDVHVPLPQIDLARTDVDLGDVPVGTAGSAVLPIANVGEESLVADLTADVQNASFDTPHVELASKSLGGARVLVLASQPGPIAAVVSVASNDPMLPVATIHVRGRAVAPSVGSSAINEDAGCGCAAAGAPVNRRAALLAVGLAAALVARRRRRVA